MAFKKCKCYGRPNHDMEYDELTENSKYVNGWTEYKTHRVLNNQGEVG